MSITAVRKPVQDSPFKKSSSEKALLKVAKRNYNKYKLYLNPNHTKRSGSRGALVTNDWSKMAEILKAGLAVDTAILNGQ